MRPPKQATAARPAGHLPPHPPRHKLGNAALAATHHPRPPETAFSHPIIQPPACLFPPNTGRPRPQWPAACNPCLPVFALCSSCNGSQRLHWFCPIPPAHPLPLSSHPWLARHPDTLAGFTHRLLNRRSRHSCTKQCCACCAMPQRLLCCMQVSPWPSLALRHPQKELCPFASFCACFACKKETHRCFSPSHILHCSAPEPRHTCPPSSDFRPCHISCSVFRPVLFTCFPHAAKVPL